MSAMIEDSFAKLPSLYTVPSVITPAFVTLLVKLMVPLVFVIALLLVPPVKLKVPVLVMPSLSVKLEAFVVNVPRL